MSEDFVGQAGQFLENRPVQPPRFTVLTLCSLKAYKGVDVFVRLARAMPGYQFLLVLNAGMEQIRQYFIQERLPENLVIFPEQKKVHDFYQQAHLVLNLSHPEQWVETFGMTLLEAMQYGLPVIAPPVGGPVELVKDDFNGYKIDQRDFGKLVSTISCLADDAPAYQRLSANAVRFARQFNAGEQGRLIREALLSA